MKLLLFFPHLLDIYYKIEIDMENYKPFKQYREMDDEQKRKISNNPNLHKPKPQAVKDKIADTMRKRWAATPSRKDSEQETTIYDIML